MTPSPRGHYARPAQLLTGFLSFWDTDSPALVTYRQNAMVPSSRSIRQLTMSPAAHD